MILLKALSAIMILFVYPILLGFFIIKFLKNEKKSVFFSIVLGYIFQFAICQIIAVPMISLECSFKTLFYTYISVVSILSIISIILNFRSIKEIIKYNIENIKIFPKLLSIITVILIFLQIYVFIGYTHIDDDDYFYVATATVSVQTNTLYKYAPETGEQDWGNHKIARYRLAPFPLYTAIVSEAIQTHPAITAHVVLPVVFIPIVYIIYGVIADEIFKENKKNIFIFLIFLSILHIWGNYSKRNNFTFLLFRIWQGKSVLANMILPSIILFFIKAEKNQFRFWNCFLLLITILAGIFTTTMGIGISPLMLMILSFSYEITRIDYKNLKNNNYKLNFINILKCFTCCIPAILFGVAYFTS